MATISTTTTGNPVGNSPQKSYTGPLIALTSLFFMWGFITCMNDILVPFLKKMFELTRTQSLLVQFAFFGAYFIGSLVYFIISTQKGDPILRIGYKNGLILGLLVSAIGCFLFYPASLMGMYGLFLTALMILAFGFTLLQIAANPYVSILGPAESASSRLNLSGAFNSLGTAIAPIIGGFLIFSFFSSWGSPLLNRHGEQVLTDGGSPISVVGVQVPYLVFGGIFLLLAIIIKLTKLPELFSDNHPQRGAAVFKYPHLLLGVLAIFMYVGGEVTVGSVIINFMHETTGVPEMTAKSYLAFYWGGAMIGRFLGAISLSSPEASVKKSVSMLVVALATFFCLWCFIWIESDYQFGLSQLYPYIAFIGLNYILFHIGQSKPHRTLYLFSFAVVGLLIITLSTTGMAAVWPIIGIGLFNSIMWPNIFTLAIRDLGKHTSQASSLLIMAILGGALVPLAQAAIADAIGGYHYSFFVPIVCYLYIAFYGLKGYKAGLSR